MSLGVNTRSRQAVIGACLAEDKMFERTMMEEMRQRMAGIRNQGYFSFGRDIWRLSCSLLSRNASESRIADGAFELASVKMPPPALASCMSASGIIRLWTALPLTSRNFPSGLRASGIMSPSLLPTPTVLIAHFPLLICSAMLSIVLL